MSGSNFCFLICNRFLRKHVRWSGVSHLFKTFPQFVVIQTIKGFSILNGAEVDVFLGFTCFSYDPANVVEKAMATHSSTLSCLENSMDRGASWAAVNGVAMSWARLSDFTFTFHFHALEEEMATHSSVLAWRIPGRGEPGGLPSPGSHRVR